MSVPKSKESRQTFHATDLEEVLWYATRPFGDVLDVIGGGRMTAFRLMDAGSRCILDHDQQSPDTPRAFLRLLMPVCRAPQMSFDAIGFNVVGLKTGSFCHLTDDRRVYEVPRGRDPNIVHTRETAPGRYCLFGDLEPSARILLLQRDGIPVPRSECFVKLHLPVVPAGTDHESDEVLTALIPATGELVALPLDTLVIRLGED
jgi:hypothetical protein